MHSRLRKRTVERQTCRRNSKPYLTCRTKAQERTPRPFLQPFYASRLRSEGIATSSVAKDRNRWFEFIRAYHFSVLPDFLPVIYYLFSLPDRFALRNQKGHSAKRATTT